MAVTVNEQPGTSSAVGQGVRFIFDVSDPGAGTERRLSYLLTETASGDAVFPRRAVERGDGTIILDFAQNIEPVLSTTLPTLDSTSLFTDAEFEKVFSLNIQEKDFNETTGGVTTPSTQDFASLRVFNCAPQWDEASLFLSASDPVVLSYKPDNFTAYRTQHDWIWIRTGSTSVSLNYRVKDENGTNINFSTPGALPTNSAVAVPIGPANIAVAVGTGVQLEITGTSGATTFFEYNIYIQEDCAPADKHEIYWQEPLGGYASLRFDNRIESTQRNVTTTEAERVRSTSLTTKASTGGLSSVNGNSYDKYTLTTELDYDEDMQKYIAGLLASENHFVYRSLPTINVMNKVILENADVQYFADDQRVLLSLTFREHQNINTLSQ